MASNLPALCLLMCVLGAHCAVYGRGQGVRLPVGINLNALNDFQNMWPFTNLMMMSSAFSPKRNSNGQFVYAAATAYPTAPSSPFYAYPLGLPLPPGLSTCHPNPINNNYTNPNNYDNTNTNNNNSSTELPASACGWLVNGQIVAETRIGGFESWEGPPAPVGYLPGVYTVSWYGKGSILLAGDAVANLTTAKDSNIACVNVTAVREGIVLRIIGSDPEDPVRNISIVPTALGPSPPLFSPHFLELIRPFRILRFAGWQRELAILSSSEQWGARTTPSHSTQTLPSGVAFEYMAQLCLVTNTSCWLSVPKAANVEYVENMAVLLVRMLINNPFYDGVVYIEYSNHVALDPMHARKLSAIVDIFEGALSNASARAYSGFNSSQLRARTRFVGSVAGPQFLPQFFKTFADLTPDYQSLSKIDIVAVQGAIGTELGWHDESRVDIPAMLNKTDAELLAALRSASLDVDMQHNRVAAELVTRNWNGTLGKDLQLMIYHGGIELMAPAYGARFRLSTTNAANVTAALREAADVEQLWHDRLMRLNQHAALQDILLDHMIRFEKTGATGYVAGDLMRAPMPLQRWGLRTSGNSALVESWRKGWATLSSSNENLTMSAASAVIAGNGTALQGFIAEIANNSPLYAALVAYISGKNASIPYVRQSNDRQERCVPGCVWGTCYNATCHCFAGMSGATCNISTHLNVGCRSQHVGMNVGGLADYSTQIVYNDIFKQSRHWISQIGYQNYGFSGWELGALPELDRRGYPLQLNPGYAVGAMMLRDLQGHYPPGDYEILWDGDGVIDVWMDVVKVLRVEPGRMVVTLKPSTGLNNGLFLRIERTNPDDPVRNVRVLSPGVSDDMNRAFPFNPLFLHMLRNFTTLRMMDLANTNAQADVRWEDRTHVEDRTFTINGMPIEHMVLLANTLKTNLWLNMPHAVDDDYLRQYAILVRDTLRPDVNVTLEYSNEVWGTLFPGGKYAQMMGVRGNYTRFSGVGYEDSNEARFCFYAVRSMEIWQIWRDVWTANVTAGGFGPEGRRRLRFVLASQSVNADVTRRILACNAAGTHADAVAIAPYFDGYLTRGNSGRDADILQLDHVFNYSIPESIATLNVSTREHLIYATRYNISLITYEAGQSLLASTHQQQQLAIAANRDPRMGDMYSRYLDILTAAQVQDILLFSSVALPSRFGSWGLIEALNSDINAEYKYQAVMNYINKRGGCAHSIPSALSLGCGDAQACNGNGWCLGSTLPWQQPSSCSCLAGFTGRTCDNTSYIDYSTCSYQCSGRGVCALQRIVGHKRYFACNCDAGYSGDHCLASECPNHCSWNGRCIAAGKCACYAGFAGADCSLDCGCGRHGVCAWMLNVTGITQNELAQSAAAGAPPSCVCDAGYVFQRNEHLMRAPTNRTAAQTYSQDAPTIATSGSFANSSLGTYYAAGRCVPHCAKGCPAGARCLRPGICSCPRCVNGDCINGTCSCWMGFWGNDCSLKLRLSMAARENALTSRLSPVGMNLGGITYWSRDIPFIDAMKSSSDWIPQYAEDLRPHGVYVWDLGDSVFQNLTADGWPRSIARGYAMGKLIARDTARTWPNGRYVVRYDGHGDLFFGMDATIISQRLGRMEVDVQFSEVRDNGIYLKVESVDPLDPIRNIRIILPGFEDLADDGFEFHPRFLESLRSYSALRFMDWAQTNGNTESQWTERPVASASSYGAGVPLETMVHLCNILAVDPWFNLPSRASPEYVSHYAALVRAQLRNDVMVYVERSNEVWNTLFLAGEENWDEARRLGITAAALHAAKSVQLIKIWEAVWGMTERRKRIIHVLSTHTVNTWVTRTMLSYNETWKHVDAIGVTAYIDCGGIGSRRNAQAASFLSVEQILDACDAVRPSVMRAWQGQVEVINDVLNITGGGSISPLEAIPSATPSVAPTVNPSTALNATNITAFVPELPFNLDFSVPLKPNPSRMPLIVYEAGPALVEQAVIEGPAIETAGLAEKLIAANRHPRMEQTYRAYLDSFQQLGLVGGRGHAYPYMHFSSVGAPSKYGSWGLLEHWQQAPSDSPKARALLSFIEEVVRNLTRTGCTQRSASNYDPLARVDDKSCKFLPIAVNSSGAVIAQEGAGISLILPAGSVAAPVGITVAEVSALNVTVVNASTYTLATPIFQFGPAGTRFLTPVNACIMLNLTDVEQYGWSMTQPDAASDSNTTDKVLHLYHSSDGINWEASEQASYDADSGQLCGTLWHFTLVAGMRVSAAVLQQDITVATIARREAAASQSGGLDSGGIAGLAVLGAIVIIGVLFVFVRRSRTRRSGQVNPTPTIESQLPYVNPITRPDRSGSRV